MNKLIVIFLSLILLFPIKNYGQDNSQLIIPYPNEVVLKDGWYSINQEFLLNSNNKNLDHLIEYAVSMLGEETQLKGIPTIGIKNKSDLNLVLENTEDKTEGAYNLIVNNNGITIKSSNEQGLFYGLQTLRQLFLERENKLSIRFIEIKDIPRFGWRAFMLDEGRYFKGKEQVKKLLNEMARLKMNIFHWHLVDDQGWRIEIKKYPLLTEIGSKRLSTQVGPKKWESSIQSGVHHAGYYTQNDIKEIVAYANDRYITIVPEIEMPGHASSAIAAYSWLGSSGKNIEVPINFGVGDEIYNVADPRVFNFLTDVLDEVIALFPSKIIHIGGDEAKYDHWKKSEKIIEYMAKNKLQTFSDVQVDFTNRIAKYIESKGRKMMGWNDILGKKIHGYQDEGEVGGNKELSKSSIVHFWRGDIELMAGAAEGGYDIVNSLHSETYLDYSYEDISLKRAYDFDPVPANLASKYHNRIIGSGCQMWGEWIPTSGYMDYFTFPRIAAYAEVGWTNPKQKDFKRFLESLEEITETWKKKGIYFAPLSEALSQDGIN